MNYGGSATFTMTPAIGFRVADVVVDGTVRSGSVPTYTFTNVTANHTIAVVWGASSFTITSSTGANGTIAPLGATVVPALGSHVTDALWHVSDAAATPTPSHVWRRTRSRDVRRQPGDHAEAGANGTISPAVHAAPQRHEFTMTPNASRSERLSAPSPATTHDS